MKYNSCMINLLGNVPTRMNSHNAGWTHCLKSIASSKSNYNIELINEPERIHEFTTVIINNGINYKKDVWNFFGGVQQKTLDYLHELNKYKGLLFTFNEPIDFRSLLKRKEITTIPSKQVFCGSTIDNKLILGDSHSLSIYKPGWGINRLDGKTLHGFLKEPYKYFNKENTTDLTLYFGNIDIRFHLMRQPNPEQAVLLLVNRLLNFIAEISPDINVTIQELLPIEDESRKIPGSGMYKGQPFYGSKEERQNLVNLFNKLIKDSIDHNHPYKVQKMWLDYPLHFNCMEARQSVHIRPDYYLHKNTFINDTRVPTLL